MAAAEHKSNFELTKDTPVRARYGVCLLMIFGENFVENAL